MTVRIPSCSSRAASIRSAASRTSPELCPPGNPDRTLVAIAGADHLFTGRLQPLREAVRRHYQPLFAGAAGTPP